MMWYEIINSCLLFITISACLYYVYQQRIFAKCLENKCITIKEEIFIAQKVLINGILLTQFYYAISLYIWIIRNMSAYMGGITSPQFLIYVISESFRNIFFMFIIAHSIFWIKEKIKHVRCDCINGKAKS